MKRRHLRHLISRAGRSVSALLFCFLIISESVLPVVAAEKTDASVNSAEEVYVEEERDEYAAGELLSSEETGLLPSDLEWDASEADLDAAVCVDDGNDDPLPMGAFTKDEYWDRFGNYYFYNRMTADEKKLYSSLYDYGMELLNGDSSLTNGPLHISSIPGLNLYYGKSFSSSGLTAEQARRVQSIFQYQNPQFYFFYGTNIATVNVIGGSSGTKRYALVRPMVFEEFKDGADRQQATATFRANIDSWYKELAFTDGMSDLKKEKAVHDMLIKKVTYDRRTDNIYISHDQSAYSVLGDGNWYKGYDQPQTVCAGFAQCFALFMNGEGIDTVVLTSSGTGAHEWNKIRLNDSWYICDVTWDNHDKATPDVPDYTFFNRSDEKVDSLDKNDSHDETSAFVPRSSLRVWPKNLPVANMDSEGKYDELANYNRKKLSKPEITFTKRPGNLNLYNVTLSSAEDANIYFDVYYNITDEDRKINPSEAYSRSHYYTESFAAFKGTEIRAMAAKDSYTDSDIASIVIGDNYTVTFDPQKGTMEPQSLQLTLRAGESFAQALEDEGLSSLPVPVREGCEFTGWYTGRTDGVQVGPDTVISSDEKELHQYVYAHYRRQGPVPEAYFEEIRTDGTTGMTKAGGGDASVNRMAYVRYGTSVDLSSPGKVLYSIDASENVVTEYTEPIKIEKDTVIYAVTGRTDKYDTGNLLTLKLSVSECAADWGDLENEPHDKEYLAAILGKYVSELKPSDIPSAEDGVWIAGLEGEVEYKGSPVTFPDHYDPDGYFHVYSGNRLLVRGTDYKLSYKNNTKPASASDAKAPTLTMTGKTYYTGKVEWNFSIKESPVSAISNEQDALNIKNKAYIANLGKTYTYTGADIEPAFMLISKENDASLNGISAAAYNRLNATEREKYDYVYTFYNNRDAGTAGLVIRGRGAWKGEIKKSFKIRPCSLSCIMGITGRTEGHEFKAVVDASAQYIKDGAKASVTITDTYDGKSVVLKEGRDYRLKFKNNKTYGAAAELIAVGRGNYSGKFLQGFRVAQGDISELILIPTDVTFSWNIKFRPKFAIYDKGGKKLAACKDYAKDIVYTYAEESAAYIRKDGAYVSILREQGDELMTGEIPAPGAALKLTVKGMGNYTGAITQIVKIADKGYDLKKASVKVSAKEYTGGEIKPGKADMASVRIGKTYLESKDYQVVARGYYKNTCTGNAYVTLKGVGTYSGYKKVKFRISKRRLRVIDVE